MATRANILGISAWYHDAAACLVQDGRITAAAQEERFTRKKHDARFPESAIRYCLEAGGLQVRDLTHVVFYEKPFQKFDRLLHTYLATAPRGLASFLMAMPGWLREKLWQKAEIHDRLGRLGPDTTLGAPILFTEHHEAHAASAFLPSPFPEAAILTVDGVGEWATTSWGLGQGADFELRAEQHFPHSLGLLYSAFTYYCGFKVNSGEYKLMGLAPYGEPRFADLIRRELVEVKPDGSFRLNLDYFDFAAGLRMTHPRFHRLFGGPPRRPESVLTPRDMDLARSIQEVTEEILIRMARHVHRETGLSRLCLAGGVALNCVANGRLLKESGFGELWIQPAAGDAGGALGAALAVWHRHLNQPRTVEGIHDSMQGALLGPAYASHEIRAALDAQPNPAESSSQSIQYTLLPEAKLLQQVATRLAEGQIVGWFQGRMEFGPRALGARSILGDPRSERMQSQMNLAIKFRESFRPFAPVVLRERVGEWFDLEADSPYMLVVAPVARSRCREISDAESRLQGLEKLHVARSRIPAVTHVDGSARIQTVSAETHPRLAALLREFDRLTGCPVLVNTSFNVRGEPMVATPADALRCFRRTNLDALVLGDFLVTKTGPPLPLDADPAWLKEFELD